MLSKREKRQIVCLILFFAFILRQGMKQEVIQILNAAMDSCKTILYSLDSVWNQFNDGKGIVHIVCSHPIAFSLVGIILPFIPFDKETNSIIGKVCYWLISIIISPTLEVVENNIFK